AHCYVPHSCRMLALFVFNCCVHHRDLHSFPTRRSSDLDFAKRIAAAAGFSTNIELVPHTVKLGGNGPIMALALAKSGAAVTCIGTLGLPEPHPVFAELAQLAEVISIANPGRTQALEFRDGKLMLGRLESLYGLSWERLLEHVPVARWLELCGRAQLLAMNNWTMIPAMTDIWRRFLAEVAPQ